MKWAGLMSMALIIMGLVYYLTGMTDMETGRSGFLNTLLSYVISIGAIVMGIAAYKKENGGYLSIGQGVKQGVLIGLIAGIIMAIWTFVFFSFLEPDMLESIKENALSQQGDIDEDQEEMMNKIMGFMFNPVSMTFLTVFSKFCLGLIIGFFAGLIMKVENPETFLDQP